MQLSNNLSLTSPIMRQARDRSAILGNKPKTVANFARNYYRANGVTTTFADMFTFTRPSSATYFDASGNLQTAASGVARTAAHVWDGSAWVNKGLLIESEARTNLLLNSGTLSTQSVTVTAATHTLHFSGTGTITLSGASTAGPLVGIGTGNQNRVSLTFTPTAGTLTLTVSGTITNAQLEPGATPSSYIPTAGAQATRAAETLQIPAAKMSYDAAAMWFTMKGLVTYADNNIDPEVTFLDWLALPGNFIRHYINTTGANTGFLLMSQDYAGTFDSSNTNITYFSPSTNVPFSISGRHGATFVQGAVNGAALTQDSTPAALPDLSTYTLKLAQKFNGYLTEFRQGIGDIGSEGIIAGSAA